MTNNDEYIDLAVEIGSNYTSSSVSGKNIVMLYYKMYKLVFSFITSEHCAIRLSQYSKMMDSYGNRFGITISDNSVSFDDYDSVLVFSDEQCVAETLKGNNPLTVDQSYKLKSLYDLCEKINESIQQS